MRTFIYRLAVAAILLAVASSFAQADEFMYFKKKAAGGVTCPGDWCEGFEATGYDTGAIWTTTPTVNPDYGSCTSMFGSQCLQLDNTGSAYRAVDATDEAWVFFAFTSHDSGTGTEHYMQLCPSSTCSNYGLDIYGMFSSNIGRFAQAGVTANITEPVSGTTYYCWAHTKRGATASTGIFQGVCSTSACSGGTCTKPANTVNTTNGAWDDSPDYQISVMKIGPSLASTRTTSYEIDHIIYTSGSTEPSWWTSFTYATGP